MTDLQALLDQIDRLDQQATKEPWHVALEEDENGVKFPWAIFGPKNDLWGAQGWGDEHYIQEIPELTTPDAELIALTRTALPKLAKALQAVMEIHKPFHADHYYNGMDGESLHRFVPRCDGCEEAGGIEDYPCPTVQAIADAMEHQ